MLWFCRASLTLSIQCFLNLFLGLVPGLLRFHAQEAGLPAGILIMCPNHHPLADLCDAG